MIFDLAFDLWCLLHGGHDWALFFNRQGRIVRICRRCYRWES